MIQIKDKVNKTQLFKDLTEIGKKRFEFTCEPDEDLKVFLDGAEALFKLLRLPVVVWQSEQLKCRHQYMNAGTLQGHAMKKCLKCGDYVKAL